MFLYLNFILSSAIAKTPTNTVNIQDTHKPRDYKIKKKNAANIKLQTRKNFQSIFAARKSFLTYKQPRSIKNFIRHRDNTTFILQKPAKEAHRTFPPKLIFDRKKPKVLAGINPRSLFYHFEGDLAILYP